MIKFMRAIAVTLVLGVGLSACSLPSIDSLFGKTANNTSTGDSSGNDVIKTVSKEDDDRIKSLIKDYFSSLYSEGIDRYSAYSVAGKIPDKLKDFISNSTKTLADGNPEIGIHLPRYMDINGMTVVYYEISKINDGTGIDSPVISSKLAGCANDNAYYYVKLDLIAKCISEQNFKLLYAYNEQTKMWTKKDAAPLDEKVADYVRLEARYDVEVAKEDGNYKISAAKEANTQNNAANRLALYNNDFVRRLPLINISKTEDGTSFINPEDGKTYDIEKAAIVSFFSSMKNSLNSENMKLLNTKWTLSTADFKNYIGKISQAADDNGKKFNELVDIKDDYKSKFDYDSLPLQPGMIKQSGKFRSIEVTPYQGYTKKTKIYTVDFEVPVMVNNGTVEGMESIYKFNYTVILSGAKDSIKISGIKLNGCTKVESASSENAAGTENTTSTENTAGAAAAQ